MKKVVITLIALSIVLICSAGSGRINFSSNGGSYQKFDESKLQFTKQRTLKHFEGVSIDDICVNARIHFADEYKIIIRTNMDFENLITTEVKQNILTISMKKDDLQEKMIACDIYMPSINSIECSGAVSLILDEGYCEKLDINIYGASNIDSENFSAKKTIINMSGAGNISFGKAEVDFLEIKCSGVGNVSAEDYRAKEVFVKASGIGNFDVYATEKFTKNVFGLAIVTNHGK